MGEDLSSGPTDLSPDHSTCRNCTKPITWSEYSYVHDDNGFADCGVKITGGTVVGVGVTLDPDISGGGVTVAEPVTWDGFVPRRTVNR
jgi:hypothetical protein